MSAHTVRRRNLTRRQSKGKWKEKTDYLLPDCKNTLPGVSGVHNFLNLFQGRESFEYVSKDVNPDTFPTIKKLLFFSINAL